MAAAAQGVLAGGPPVGPGAIFSLSVPAALEVLATDAGFRDVSVRPVDVTFRAASFDDHFARVTSMAGPLAGALAAAPPDTLEAVRRTAADLASRYVTDGGVELPGRALLLAGHR